MTEKEGEFGVNKDATPLRVSHAHLERYSDESAFRSVCPVCKEGVLMVARDQKSLELINVDRCTWCAQVFVYTDKTIAGAPVVDVVSKPS